jgi:hypothetical protein
MVLGEERYISWRTSKPQRHLHEESSCKNEHDPHLKFRGDTKITAVTRSVDEGSSVVKGRQGEGGHCPA